jgi:hypothetical protein
MVRWRGRRGSKAVEAPSAFGRSGEGDRKSGHLSHRDVPAVSDPEGFDRMRRTGPSRLGTEPRQPWR